TTRALERPRGLPPVPDRPVSTAPEPFPSPSPPASSRPPPSDPFRALPSVGPSTGEAMRAFKRIDFRPVLYALVGVALVALGAAIGRWVMQEPPPVPELVVRSAPAGAVVRLDGELLEGTTPLTIPVELVAGRPYRVKVEMPGHRAWESTVVPQPGPIELMANLPPERRTLIVETDPQGALVRVDGHRRGRAPVTLEELRVGNDYLIRVERDGRVKEVPLSVTPDLADTLVITLPAPRR
ncbi:MAG: PEGA domain-containing protein, partial [Myxococcota bacterium]